MLNCQMKRRQTEQDRDVIPVILCLVTRRADEANKEITHVNIDLLISRLNSPAPPVPRLSIVNSPSLTSCPPSLSPSSPPPPCCCNPLPRSFSPLSLYFGILVRFCCDFMALFEVTEQLVPELLRVNFDLFDIVEGLL